MTIGETLEANSEPEPNSGCLLWLGSRMKNGYGRITLPGGQRDYVHRTAYRERYGEIPSDRPFVCHRCDVQTCIAPAHLFAGTNTDNHDDMVRKHRHRWNPAAGEASPNAKLTAEQVGLIRSLYAGPHPRRRVSIPGKYQQPALARLFGMSQPQISTILRGKAWRNELSS